MCKLKVEGNNINPSSHLFPLTIIQMRSDTSPPTPPTKTQLFQEGLAVKSLAEAEALRKKFMKQRSQGVKAWKNFAESVEAARVAIKESNE